jgi:hypothetical protein
MDDWETIPLEEAKKLAEDWKRRLAHACERVDVTGSVYRESKNPVGDVDLTCLVKSREALKFLGPAKEDSVRTVYSDRGRKIEVWRVEDPAKYDLITWYRRTSKGDFIKLATKARERGMELSWKEGLKKDGKVITADPREIERILA